MRERGQLPEGKGICEVLECSGIIYVSSNRTSKELKDRTQA